MSSVEGQNASTSLPAGSGAGLTTGTAVDFNAVYSNPFAVVSSSAALSAGTILLEGSVDGSNWYLINSLDVSTGFAAASSKIFVAAAPNPPARFLRARISVVLVGGTVNVMVGVSGS